MKPWTRIVSMVRLGKPPSPKPTHQRMNSHEQILFFVHLAIRKNETFSSLPPIPPNSTFSTSLSWTLFREYIVVDANGSLIFRTGLSSNCACSEFDCVYKYISTKLADRMNKRNGEHYLGYHICETNNKHNPWELGHSCADGNWASNLIGGIV